MNRRWIEASRAGGLPLLALLLALVLPSAVAAAGDANIRILLDRDGPVWVGEELPIHLELWTRDLSFSDQSFVLPEVSGAFLLQAEAGGMNLSERRGGESWQGLRYTFSLYPQRAGTLVVPSFAVRFSTRRAFGQPPVPHAFATDPLEVAARRPPGAEPGALLVTSSDFSVDASWSVEPAEEGEAVKLQTGDALVLTVRREADRVPGMVFAPLPAIEIEGLGVYPDAPDVSDRVYRGDFTGSRTDRVTVVAEQPGAYTLPGLAFEWWDPRAEQLRRRTLPELVVEVSVNPNWGAPPPADASNRGDDPNWDWLGWLALPVVLWWPVWPLLRRTVAWFANFLAPRRLQPLNPGRSEGRDQ